MKLGQGVALPDDYATRRVAIVAQSGGGKTYTAAVIAEELVALEQPFYALDPTGAWWGLRSSATGKRDGLPVVVIGGDHGDVPLDEHAGVPLADLVVHEPGFYVLDLSGLETRAAEVRFATAFLERLYRQKNKQRAPLHGFWDEADLFAPQRAQPNETHMLGSAESIIRRGRIRGLGTTLITQRPAVLNKNVLTQIDLLLSLKLIAPQDRKAVREYLDGVADPDLRDEVLGSLAGLQQGEAWLYGPGLKPPIYGRTLVRERKTFNSSATASGAEAEVKLAEVDLDALRERLAATIEKAKAEDPRELQRRVKELEAKLAQAPKVETVEVPILTDDARAALTGAAAAIDSAQQQMIDAVAEASVLLGELVAQLDVRPPAPVAPQRREAPVAKRPPAPVHRERPEPTGDADSLGKAPRTLLDTLIAHVPRRLSKSELSTLSGYKPKSSTYRNALSALRTAGFLDEAGGLFAPSDAGMAARGSEAPPAPQTTEKLLAIWYGALGLAPRTMLEILVAAYPAEIEKPTLAEDSGYSLTSSTFRNALSALRSNGLLEDVSGAVRASDALFITGGAHV